MRGADHQSRNWNPSVSNYTARLLPLCQTDGTGRSLRGGAWGRQARRGRTREGVGYSLTNSAGILCGLEAGSGPHSMHGGVMVLTG